MNALRRNLRRISYFHYWLIFWLFTQLISSKVRKSGKFPSKFPIVQGGFFKKNTCKIYSVYSHMHSTWQRKASNPHTLQAGTSKYLTYSYLSIYLFSNCVSSKENQLIDGVQIHIYNKYNMPLYCMCVLSTCHVSWPCPVPEVWMSEMLYFRIQGVCNLSTVGRYSSWPEWRQSSRCDLLIEQQWCIKKHRQEWKDVHVLALVSAQITKTIIFKHHPASLTLNSTACSQLQDHSCSYVVVLYNV